MKKAWVMALSFLVRLVVAGCLSLGLLVGAPVRADTAAAADELEADNPAIVAGTLETARFKIHYTARSQGAARAMAATVETMRDQFQATLGRDWPGVTEIRLGFDRAELEALALPGGKPPGWAVALAYPARNIILVDALSLSTDQGPMTLRHELCHVALGQLGGPWPRWFQEGVAMYLTGDRFTVGQYAALFRAVTHDTVFSFDHLYTEWPDSPAEVEVAYAQSLEFVSFLQERHGPQVFGNLLDGVAAGEPFELAFGKAFKTSRWVEETAWRRDLPSRYSWWPIVTGGSTLWLLCAIIAVVAYVRRRSQKAAALSRMAEEDAREDATEQALTLRLIEDDYVDTNPVAPAEASGESPGKSKPTLH